MPSHTLNPAMPVLVRPDGAVQVGWDPRRAMLVEPPDGMSAAALADLLRAMQRGASARELCALATDRGIADVAALTDLVTSLVDRGLATPTPPRTRSVAIRIHGRGPLSDLLTSALRCSGARVSQSRLNRAGIIPEATDLVVLSDVLVADPHLLRELHRDRIPHLPVYVRDGTGVVGPLVMPGVTSCLGCADLYRSDRDAAWPAVAAQLRDAVGSAGRATLLGTAALALSQVDRVIAAVRESGGDSQAADPPPTLDTTLEFDARTGSTTGRRWQRHPLCAC
ncbi:cyclodehydratase [Mycobacterium yunnanensis]|uniref:Cyclodehydratase n=1 Tax=Mycobacterium yunnanensis TaxID=368477 RepID=A0A9X2Z413_9MYCO|nr:cyclodehydratase [Mycobacterium yunnanensis]MCV7422081.1 cyclodehydratase [Mycobacterium yunnanensis]